MNQSLRFSGHETFVCKQFWLKKGFDYASAGNGFQAPDAVSSLGVGKNMVASINYWSKSFGLIDDIHDPTYLGEFLLGTKGRDTYIEDIATLWLLHYSLVKTGKASIYNLVFNEFARERTEFSKDQLLNFLKRKCFEHSENLYNETTIRKDINVLIRNYVKPKRELIKVEIEEDYTALLLDLHIIRSRESNNTDEYTFQIDSKETLPEEVLLYAILDTYKENSISFRDLFSGMNSPAQLFCISKEGLYSKIENISNLYQEIVFDRTAGNEVLQIKKEFNKWEILNEYYSKTTV